MHRHASRGPEPAPDPKVRNDWQTLRTLVPYLWEFRWRVVAALACLFAAKAANVGVPLVLKGIVDHLGAGGTAVAIPAGLLIGYGLLRLSTTTSSSISCAIPSGHGASECVGHAWRKLHRSGTRSADNTRPSRCWISGRSTTPT